MLGDGLISFDGQNGGVPHAMDKQYMCLLIADIRSNSPYPFLEWVGTGLLFIAHKVKFVARAYEYKAGSDRVCLYADLFLTLTTRGPICHSDLCWPIE